MKKSIIIFLIAVTALSLLSLFFAQQRIDQEADQVIQVDLEKRRQNDACVVACGERRQLDLPLNETRRDDMLQECRTECYGPPVFDKSGDCFEPSSSLSLWVTTSVLTLLTALIGFTILLVVSFVRRRRVENPLGIWKYILYSNLAVYFWLPFFVIRTESVFGIVGFTLNLLRISLALQLLIGLLLIVIGLIFILRGSRVAVRRKAGKSLLKIGGLYVLIILFWYVFLNFAISVDHFPIFC